jgi:prophage regulatory protein
MTQQPSKILRFKQVSDRTGYRSSAIYEKIKRGEFPKPISLGARAVGWLESEIEAWIAARVQASRNAVDGGNHAA